MSLRHPAFWRYTAFQIPGWILAAIGGWLIHQWFDIPLWLASGVLVVWVIKDYALYPFLRFAYEADHRPQIERLIGATGKAVGSIAPDGYVRVRGELWRATIEAAEPIKEDEPVEVVGVEGMTVIIRRVPKQD